MLVIHLLASVACLAAGHHINKVRQRPEFVKLLAGPNGTAEASNQTLGEEDSRSRLESACRREGECGDAEVCLVKCCPQHQVFSLQSAQCQDGEMDKRLVKLWTWDNSSESSLKEFNIKNHRHAVLANTSTDVDTIGLCSSQLTLEDCREGTRRLLNPAADPYDSYMIMADGRIYLPAGNRFYQPWPQQEYCVEQFSSHGRSSLHVLVCQPPEAEAGKGELCQARFIVIPVFLGMSCLALACTILVYLCLPELCNLPGHVLLCLCTALLCAYLLLIVSQLAGELFPMAACVAVAISMHYSFLSAFAWMTVMSYDLCKTFRHLEVSLDRRHEVDRFRQYSLAGWGLPFLMSGLTLVLDLAPVPDNTYVRPRFGVRSCWFYGDLEILLYFYSPIALMVLANTVLFGSTVTSLYLVSKETSYKKAPIRRHSKSRLYKNLSLGRERLWLYVRLFVVMGLNWIFEIVVKFLSALRE